MNKTTKRLACFLLVTMMCTSAFAGNTAQTYSATMDKHFSVTLSPANTKSLVKNIANDIELSVSTDASAYEHDTQIPITLYVKWDKENWDTSLEGEALVFNNGRQIVLFGMASGYNGEHIDENFVSLNFSYDVTSKDCIANATYDITSEQNSKVEFGVNTDLFSDAYEFLSDKMANANQEQLDSAVTMEPDVAAPASIDSSLQQIFSSGDDKAKMTMYAPKNLTSGGGSGKVSAKMYGNLSTATSYITKSVNTTAWAIVASNCDVSFSANTGLRYTTGTHAPTNSQTNYTISIPLPAAQSYAFTWNVARINSGVTGDETACHWNIYDINGIKNISNQVSPPGFFVTINQSGNTYGKIKVNGSSKIGYHYLYIDSTGQQNNSTWYARASGSGYVNVV